jgi:hypothetical protein
MPTPGYSEQTEPTSGKCRIAGINFLENIDLLYAPPGKFSSNTHFFAFYFACGGDDNFIHTI